MECAPGSSQAESKRETLLNRWINQSKNNYSMKEIDNPELKKKHQDRGFLSNLKPYPTQLGWAEDLWSPGGS